MDKLTIRHLIYTRVEPEYSPNRRNGFQTVYFSPEIKEDVNALEKRVQCFIPTNTHVEHNLTEYQYFWTDTNKAVIVHTLPIERDPHVIDAASGRTGHFVSHALVISRDQFARVGNDPFAVIEAANRDEIFTDSVEKLVQYLREVPSDQLMVERRNKFHESLDGWTVEAFEKWALLAQSAGQLASKKGSLLLLSKDPEAVYALLSAALYVMDSEHRLACTFNTFVDGCLPSPGMYWAVGARRRVSGSAFTTVDLDSPKIEVKAQADPKATPYFTWLQQESKSYVGFSRGMPEIYVAQIAAECLVEKRPLPSGPLLDTALMTFREANLERYESGLIRGLVVALGKRLGEQIAPSMLNLVGIRSIVDASAQEAIDPVVFAEPIYKWVIQHHATIKAWGDLFKFAQVANYAPLIALAGAKAPSGLLSGKKSAKASAEALDQLARAGDLPGLLGDFQAILGPEALITQTTAPIITAENDPSELKDIAFTDLVTALLKSGGHKLDGRYVVRVREITDKRCLKDLAKLVKKLDGVQANFVAAVLENQ